MSTRATPPGAAVPPGGVAQPRLKRGAVGRAGLDLPQRHPHAAVAGEPLVDDHVPALLQTPHIEPVLHRPLLVRIPFVPGQMHVLDTLFVGFAAVLKLDIAHKLPLLRWNIASIW
jgi:hypothetical protein